MCFEDSCTPNNPCYYCWAYGEGDPNHFPPDSNRVDPVQEMGSFSDLDNWVDYSLPFIPSPPGQYHQMSTVSGPIEALQEPGIPMLTQQRLQHMGALEQCVSERQVYVPGTCAKRLAEYMHMQQQSSMGSGIEFWRTLVTEYFAPHAKMRWCFSLCKECFAKTDAVSQRIWHCQICNLDPGCGYEATVEALPSLFNIKYESGVRQELLYVDMPSEFLERTGEVVIDYEKATVQTVYESLRIVRDGRLRIVFTPDLKIRSWDFCIRSVEQLLSRRIIMPQIKQLKCLTRKYELAAQNVSSNVQSEVLNKCSNMLIEAAYGFPDSLKVPSLTDMGYTKKYVRGLKISEVIDSMGDVIDYSIKMGMSPRMSLGILGSTGSQCRGPNLDENPNKKQKREPVQQEQANNYNVASENVHVFNSRGVLDVNNNHTNLLSSHYTCSSSQFPYTKSPATPAVAQVDDYSSLAAAAATAAALLSSFDDPERTSSS